MGRNRRFVVMGRHFISWALFGLTGYRDSYKSGINTIL
jgi:hypothetical protein